MAAIKISLPENNTLSGEVILEYSKSESNRVLLIRYLSVEPFIISGVSNAEDTILLRKILDADEQCKGRDEMRIYNVNHAGTAMRFLCAYFASKEGNYFLTGSTRMLERPIGPLVEALRGLGADIQYAEREGFPPLIIRGNKLEGGRISIGSNISSQFISALMLIAPSLPSGLKLSLNGEIVSYSYIHMTASVMRRFGIQVMEHENEIVVCSGHYKSEKQKEYIIEADWSAASYFYALASLLPGTEIILSGLHAGSIQPDAVCADLFVSFGVQSVHGENEVKILGHSVSPLPHFEYDFSLCPDLVQTMVVVCAAKKIPSKFTGVSTLRIKETDRISALKTELKKFKVDLDIVDDNSFVIRPEDADFSLPDIVIDTYNDHRMAMSFTALSLVCPNIIIKNPEVVTKSFPQFWNEISKTGLTTGVIN